MDRSCSNDSCNPFLNKRLHTYKIYSILLPILIIIFVLESIYIFMTIPVSLGTAITTSGPHLLSEALKSKINP